MSTTATHSDDLSAEADLDDTLHCRFGCLAPPVGIYHVPFYPLWADQVQALCGQHFLQTEGEVPIKLLRDLTDGVFGRWLHGR